MSMRCITAALLLGTLSGLAPAYAADAIKPGKWEYTVATEMPGMPQLPPGMPMPQGGQRPAGPGALTTTQTTCVSSADPVAELSRPRGPQAAATRCTVERMTRNGGTISWATTCTSPDATIRSEGTAQYAGDRMQATTRVRTTRANGQPLEVANRITGRYLGPCDGR